MRMPKDLKKKRDEFVGNNVEFNGCWTGDCPHNDRGECETKALNDCWEECYEIMSKREKETEAKTPHHDGYELAIMHFREMMLCGWTREEMWHLFKPCLYTDKIAKVPHPKPGSETKPEGVSDD